MPGADVVDLEVGAHERDHVGRVLHEVTEVRTVALDRARSPAPRPPADEPSVRAIEREAEERRERDRVRDRRARGSSAPIPTATVISPQQDRDAAPQQPGTPRARPVDAQQVGDADAVPDDEDRAPPGRVHDPRGADRGGRRRAGADRGVGASRLSNVCTTRVGDAARHEQRRRAATIGVSAMRCACCSQGRPRIATGPAVKTSSDAPTTPQVRPLPRTTRFTKEISGRSRPKPDPRLSERPVQPTAKPQVRPETGCVPNPHTVWVRDAPAGPRRGGWRRRACGSPTRTGRGRRRTRSGTPGDLRARSPGRARARTSYGSLGSRTRFGARAATSASVTSG